MKRHELKYAPWNNASPCTCPCTCHVVDKKVPFTTTDHQARHRNVKNAWSHIVFCTILCVPDFLTLLRVRVRLRLAHHDTRTITVENFDSDLQHQVYTLTERSTSTCRKGYITHVQDGKKHKTTQDAMVYTLSDLSYTFRRFQPTIFNLAPLSLTPGRVSRLPFIVNFLSRCYKESFGDEWYEQTEWHK